MTESLKGTAALVTGASSGIGAATALNLAARGATVSLVARRGDRLARLADRILADGGAAVAIVADLSDGDQARAAVEKSVREWGRLDILVNNAGIARPASALEAQISDWEDMIQLNLTGSLYCLHAALPHLVEAAGTEPRRVADLINISSLSGRIFRKGSAVYCATKHAMNAYSESLRQELADLRVRVTVLEPAAVETELFAADVRDRRRANRGYPPLVSGLKVCGEISREMANDGEFAMSVRRISLDRNAECTAVPSPSSTRCRRGLFADEISS